jgi:hypothetical protein
MLAPARSSIGHSVGWLVCLLVCIKKSMEKSADDYIFLTVGHRKLKLLHAIKYTALKWMHVKKVNQLAISDTAGAYCTLSNK